jgi:acyl dehydratase
MRTFDSIEDLAAAEGEHLGFSDWLTIDQHRVDTFAEATGDHQWIHVDPERARSGPFGGTIAHGYLTLSLVPLFVAEVVTVNGLSMKVNYGSNKVRFPAPVPVGSRIRAGVEVLSVASNADGAQLVLRTTVEIEGGGSKPACVAETVTVLLR